MVAMPVCGGRVGMMRVAGVLAVTAEDRLAPAVGVGAVDDPADRQHDAAGDRPVFRDAVMVIVRVMIVADKVAGLVRVGGEAGGRHRVEDGRGGDALGIEGRRRRGGRRDRNSGTRRRAWPARGESAPLHRRSPCPRHADESRPAQGRRRLRARVVGLRQGLPRRGRRPSRRPSASRPCRRDQSGMSCARRPCTSCRTSTSPATRRTSPSPRDLRRRGAGTSIRTCRRTSPCSAELRMLMPSTAALLFLNFGRLSWNAQDSLVQPGVSSFG